MSLRFFETPLQNEIPTSKQEGARIEVRRVLTYEAYNKEQNDLLRATEMCTIMTIVGKMTRDRIRDDVRRQYRICQKM